VPLSTTEGQSLAAQQGLLQVVVANIDVVTNKLQQYVRQLVHMLSVVGFGPSRCDKVLWVSIPLDVTR
jgi:hypothetical protein